MDIKFCWKFIKQDLKNKNIDLLYQGPTQVCTLTVFKNGFWGKLSYSLSNSLFCAGQILTVNESQTVTIMT